jgi:hypothetical protein
MQLGNKIEFGKYEWHVLDVREDKALIITEDVVEQRQYHDKYTDITWETCDLRKYLNGEFLGKFDSERIATTINKNADNLWYGSNGGDDTQDKIFLLSLEEVDYYFGNSGDYTNKRRKDGNGKSKSDGYYLSNNYDSSRVAKNGKGEACWWWLRSPGIHGIRAAGVGGGGRVRVSGSGVSYYYGGVRPALCLAL